MNLLSIFKGIGRVFVNLFTLVKKVVPEEMLVKGIELVRVAAEKFADNALRRDWVLNELTGTFHLPESVARLVVELAVQHVKHDAIDKGAEKLEDAART